MSARSIFFVFARKGGGVVKRTSNDITAGNGRERFMIAVKFSLNIFLFTFFLHSLGITSCVRIV